MARHTHVHIHDVGSSGFSPGQNPASHHAGAGGFQGGSRAETMHSLLGSHGFQHMGETHQSGTHLYKHASGGYMHVNHSTGSYHSVSPHRSDLPGGKGGKALAGHLSNNYPGGKFRKYDGSGQEYWNSRK